MNINEFKQLPLMGIVRAAALPAVEPFIETVIASGLKTLEVTMNTLGATGFIRKAVSCAGDRLTIGAGTVLSTAQCEEALAAGATFIVSPTLVAEVAGECRRKGVAVFPGAFSPQEIYDAHQAGAAMVKVFPVRFLGPDYIKEIKGPFGDIELLACGGVRPANIKTYFAAGASAIAFGGSVFKQTWLSRGDFQSIGREIRDLITAYKNSEETT